MAMQARQPNSRNSPGVDWLIAFAGKARLSDQFRKHKDHRGLLAAGLFGEAGSVLAELKKVEREGSAYPNYHQRLLEELGDCLWYFVRLAALADARLLDELVLSKTPKRPARTSQLELAAEFGTAVGQVLRSLRRKRNAELREALLEVWWGLGAIAYRANIQLKEAAASNLEKTGSRWPERRHFHALFDDDFPAVLERDMQFPDKSVRAPYP